MSTSVEVLVCRVVKLFKTIVTDFLFGGNWCVQEGVPCNNDAQPSVQTINLKYWSIVSCDWRAASRKLLCMSCFLRSSDVARCNNNVVLYPWQDEYKIQTNECKGYHIGYV